MLCCILSLIHTLFFYQVRDDFESLKSSLHPHLSSLASLAQGAPLSTPSSVFALAGGGASGGFPYAPPAFLAPAPPPSAQPAGSASSSSSEGSAAGWSFEEQYKQVRQVSTLISKTLHILELRKITTPLTKSRASALLEYLY